MMKVLYDICDMMEDELRELKKKGAGALSPTDLDNMYKMIDIVKDIKTIDAMKEAGYSEASRRSYDDMSYASRRSYEGPYEYSEDGSYRRGRDAMGRYTSRDDYSGHDKKEIMIEKLRDMMRSATDEHERDNIRQAISILER